MWTSGKTVDVTRHEQTGYWFARVLFFGPSSEECLHFKFDHEPSQAEVDAVVQTKLGLLNAPPDPMISLKEEALQKVEELYLLGVEKDTILAELEGLKGK